MLNFDGENRQVSGRGERFELTWMLVWLAREPPISQLGPFRREDAECVNPTGELVKLHLGRPPPGGNVVCQRSAGRGGRQTKLRILTPILTGSLFLGKLLNFWVSVSSSLGLPIPTWVTVRIKWHDESQGTNTAVVPGGTQYTCTWESFFVLVVSVQDKG